MPRDRDRAATQFHDRFKRQRTAFLAHIAGIHVPADRAWYASLTLNRLMVVWFLQAKGLLDGHPGYVRDRLEQVRRAGDGATFYRAFLLCLFHQGLARPADRRTVSDRQAGLLGDVADLGGGLFDVHDLESRYGAIDIPDRAFGPLFDFFDRYTWRLDDRPAGGPREVTPDVLGAVFEKYVNQKQMGAYYTKPDITGYISANTIIPYVLDAVRDDVPADFGPGGPVWRILADDPSRFIYRSVRHGVLTDDGGVTTLPPAVTRGRDGWNQPAAPGYGLPTESWREYLARRDRCLELRDRLAAGSVCRVNELITANLDVRRFAADTIAGCATPNLLGALYRAISAVTVLDPTCGSGAFLLAAVDILRPLYEGCLDRMRWFVEQDAPAAARGSADVEDFRRVLGEVARHPNPGCFILASIIRNNLYGVDIMSEAVEICNLRLRLALVARLDNGRSPGALPRVEGNIRAGNALVGPTAAVGGSRPPARRPGDDSFDWAAGFPEPMARGGFDVVIGNPPYLSAEKVRGLYPVRGYATAGCPDVYAWCMERVTAVVRGNGRAGMILPLSLGFSTEFAALRAALFEFYQEHWFASFGRIPSALFSHDVRVRNTIHLAARRSASPGAHTTGLSRWNEEYRPHLFEALSFADFDPPLWDRRVPKLPSPRLAAALESVLRTSPTRVADLLLRRPAGGRVLYFKTTAYNSLGFSEEPPPCFDAAGTAIGQTQLDALYPADPSAADALFLFLNGKIAFMFWCVLGDDFHVTKQVLGEIPLGRWPPDGFDAGAIRARCAALRRCMSGAVRYKRNAGLTVGSYNLAVCRAVTDPSDRWFASRLGLGEVWDEIETYCARVIRTDFSPAGDG